MTNYKWDIRTPASADFPITINGLATSILLNGTTGAVTLLSPALGNTTITGTLGVTGNTTLIGTLSVNKAYGVAPAGASTANAFAVTLSGDPGGTTDIRSLSLATTVSGANSIASIIGNSNSVSLGHTAGTVANANVFSGILNNTNNGAVTTARALDFRSTLSVGSGVVTTLQIYYGKASKASGTGTATTVSVFYADDSGGAYATNAIGFDSVAMGAAGTLTANFRAGNTAGSGRWGVYAPGGALNAFLGGVRIGSVVAPVAMLDVTGTIASSSTVTATGFVVGANQVVGARVTGWTTQTAVAAKTDLGASPTVGALASWASAVQAALTAHGLVGP